MIKTNEKFGFWTALGYVEDFPKNKGRRVRGVMCQCECGKSRRVRERDLISGASRSCGCGQRLRLAAGTVFGRWKIISCARGTPISYICKCACGVIRPVRSNALRKGASRSCGCAHRDAVSIHGKSGSPEWIVWRGIKDRCLNQRSKDWENYGGRGITICERWLKFSNFICDMGPRPSENHSIERKNNNEGYSPQNCKWETRFNQARNKRTNVRVSFGGIDYCITDLAKIIGISKEAIMRRAIVARKRGWPITGDVLANNFKRYKPRQSA